MCTLMMSYAVGFPPIFKGHALMWLCWAILPLLSFSFLFTVHDPECMTYMSSKNTKSERKIKESWVQVERLFYRFILLSFTLLAVFGLYGSSNLDLLLILLLLCLILGLLLYSDTRSIRGRSSQEPKWISSILMPLTLLS